MFTFMKNKVNLSIKMWAEADRPREKLISKGRKILSDAELLAILIASGNKNETAVELSKRILSEIDNDLNQLGKLSFQELTKFNGIGEAKAITIIAALELGRRRKAEPSDKREGLNSSQKAFNYLHKQFIDLPHEEFWVLSLNRSNKVISKHFVSKGGLSNTVVDVRLIMKNAVNDLASSLVLAHNHPSGNLTPSESDIQITNKIKSAAQFFDITLLDHLIITDDNYFSFADEGLMS